MKISLKITRSIIAIPLFLFSFSGFVNCEPAEPPEVNIAEWSSKFLVEIPSGDHIREDKNVEALLYNQKARELLSDYRRTKSLKSLYTALNYAGEAVYLAPETANYWVTLGDIHSELAKNGLLRANEQAILSYEQAIELAPEDTSTMIILGVKLARMGLYNNASELFETAVKKNPYLLNYNVLQWMNLCYIAGAETKRGTIFYTALLNTDPDLYFLHVFNAILYASHLDKVSAEKELNKVLSNTNVNPEIRTFAEQTLKNITGEISN